VDKALNTPADLQEEFELEHKLFTTGKHNRNRNSGSGKLKRQKKKSLNPPRLNETTHIICFQGEEGVILKNKPV